MGRFGQTAQVNDMERFAAAVVAWASGDEGMRAAAEATVVNHVLLVEGISDVAAIRVLAVRRGRDFESERVAVIPMGGATNIRRFLELLGLPGLDLPVSGLSDVGEERFFRKAAEHAGLASDPDRATMEALGFFVCDPDLEGELIRSLGPAAVEAVIDGQGDLEAFRTFQNQPAQRVRPIERQLRRFMGTLKGRKERYAGALVEALDLDDVPRPLDRLVERR